VFAALVRTIPSATTARTGAMQLATTLGALVEGAAAGLIGHAVILAAQGPELAGITALAEATGADLSPVTDDHPADWRVAALLARGDWLLLIMAGEVPGQGWIQAIERHAMAMGGRPGLMARPGWRGWPERLAQRLPASRQPQSGLVLPRASLVSGQQLPAALTLDICRHGRR
jgi:hypothetical protein